MTNKKNVKSSLPSHNLNLLFALTCEAKPWVERLKLKKIVGKPFAQYVGVWINESRQSDVSINLVIAGSGQIRMAAATAWLGALTVKQNNAWLNVGTMGHIDASLGTLFRVNKATDPLSEQSLYPPMVVKSKCDSIAVKTVSASSKNYPDTAGIEMEAFAFFSIAQRFADAELVQALKVISDNADNNIDALDAKHISELMQSQIDASLVFIDSLLALLIQQPAITLFDHYIEHIRCSVTQRHQYIELMRKLEVMGQTNNQAPDFSEYRSMSVLITDLNKELDVLVPALNTTLGIAE